MKRSVIIVCLLLSFAAMAQPRKQVPILCYHQIRNWKPKDSHSDKSYIIPPANLAAQLKMLADSGYHTILPGQLYDYLVNGKSLPVKPIVLTFDDTNADQFTNALPILEQYHYKAVFFIITGKIGTHPWFMNAGQIKQLAGKGHIIGCHTTNHRDFRKLKTNDFPTEIEDSKKILEKITGQPVEFFAFPFGEWNAKGLPVLHRLGFKVAFALDQPSDLKDPIMTIRRIIVPGYWNPRVLSRHIVSDFGRDTH